MTLYSDSMDCRNEVEIRVFHVKRGGGHAIMNWLGHSAGAPVFFLNNIFSKPHKVRRRKEKIFKRLIEDRGTYGVELDPSATYREVAEMHKPVLIYNVENFELDRFVGEPLFRGGAERLLGSSRKRFTVLVLRDAFNTFASVRRGKKRWQRRLNTFYREHWKTYARELLGETSYLPEDTIKVNYNSWFLSEDYRRAVVARFGFEYTEQGLDEVPQYGGGSSFSGQEFHNRATDMDVLNRWRHYVDDEIYRAALDDETIELSNRIFGDITEGRIAPA